MHDGEYIRGHLITTFPIPFVRVVKIEMKQGCSVCLCAMMLSVSIWFVEQKRRNRWLVTSRESSFKRNEYRF